MRIYVGNLAPDVTDEVLMSTFAAHGEVVSVEVITDNDTRQSRGFGFVEMRDDGQAEAAIRNLDGSGLQGRNIQVNVARPRTERSGGGGDPVRRRRW